MIVGSDAAFRSRTLREYAEQMGFSDSHHPRYLIRRRRQILLCSKERLLSDGEYQERAGDTVAGMGLDWSSTVLEVRNTRP
jgi:hypothetical protein